MSRIVYRALSTLSMFSITLSVLAAEDIPAPAFTVDSRLKPATPSISGVGQKARSLARVSDSHRHVADFVENEMLIFSNDTGAVHALAERWRGQVVSQSVFPKGAKTPPPMVSLVVIDSTLADPAILPADARKADPLSRGDHGVSTVAGLRTLAAAAHENASGIAAAVNFVFSPASLANDLSNWTTAEDNMTDAFQEPYLCEVHHVLDPSQCVQNIGVGAAWRALQLSGKLDNRVNVAIWDSGFAPNQDFPMYHQITPLSSANQAGPGTCEGSPCPFHGTNVVAAGFAVPDNAFGDAGPGGALTNIHLDLVSSPSLSLDLFGFFQSLYGWISSISDAQILNISAGIDIPSSVCLAVCPVVSDLTAALREINILLIAAAMNDGRNVDDRTCVALVCWESSKLLPCEFDSVLCVGGLDTNSVTRAAGSNFGSDSTDPNATNTVRLFAPFSVRMYDQHPSPYITCNKHGVCMEDGTSFSAPFVAGVAALVWAANPNLGASDVENILLSTATPSPDPTVNRYVNALAAVRTALGNPAQPSIRIVCPGPGSIFPPVVCPHPSNSYDPGTDITIQAIATDEISGADLSANIVWQGQGFWAPQGGSLIIQGPVPGTIPITASIAFAGVTKTASVALTIQNYLPAINISCPVRIETDNEIDCTGSATKGHQNLSVGIVWTYVYPGQPAHQKTGPTLTLAANTFTVLPGQSQTTLLITAAIPNATTSASIVITPAHVDPVVTITTASQFKPQCQRPVPNLPCTPFFTASLVGTDHGIPVYQANNISLAGSAIDDHGNAVSGLTWYMLSNQPTSFVEHTAAGPGFAQGNTWTGAMQFKIPLTSPATGTANNPFVVYIMLQADDGRGGINGSYATFQVVTQ